MSTVATIVVVVVAVVALALIAWFLQAQLRRRQLRDRFGPEYDRALEDGTDRRTAERELLDRQRRHAELDIKPLDASARTRYAREWVRVQAGFVDDPGGAVALADRLVTAVIAERGYPTEGYQQQLSDLSVQHSASLRHYRGAHDVLDRHASNQASTEDLRVAMTDYRVLFQDLLGPADGDVEPKADKADKADQRADERAMPAETAHRA